MMSKIIKLRGILSLIQEDVVYIKLDPNEDTGLDYAQIISATAKLTSE